MGNVEGVDASDCPEEVNIGTYFSSSSSTELAVISDNHCVPIYGTLQVPDEDHWVIIVMPVLRDPPFEMVGDVVESFTQISDVSSFLINI